jgi:hypothetical protein
MSYNYLSAVDDRVKTCFASTSAANKASFCLRFPVYKLPEGCRRDGACPVSTQPTCVGVIPPLGVASTLRRVKSKAPALQYRAESPAINSIGQRPVWKGHSLPLGVASTLRRVKSKAPALQYRAESPVINSTGQRPVWKRHSPVNKPQRGGIKSNSLISPFQGYGGGAPLFTGRCPVLMIVGLSALYCKAGALLLTRRSVDATPSEGRCRRCAVRHRGGAIFRTRLGVALCY